MGPRRVGKTVLIHHAIDRLMVEGVEPRRIAYFSVDHPVYNGLALEDLLACFQNATGTDYVRTSCFVFFDEIQYLRDWEVHLKALVDSYPKVLCVASGSAAAALRLKGSESGAGRFTDFLLPPLTFYEYLKLIGEAELAENIAGNEQYAQAYLPSLNKRFLDYLNFGGYPEAVLSEAVRDDPGRFIKSDIIDKVLLRDLPSLYGIQDVQELNYLFTTLAFNTAGEVSLEQLSQASGVAKNTIRRYIDYLEAAFLIRSVHRVDRNARRFKRATFFKVYLTNPSIRTALFSPVDEEDDATGPLVETAILAQWFHGDLELHYARWKGGEVGIVNVDARGRIEWVIEAKWTDRYFHHPEQLKSLLAFCRSQKMRQNPLVTARTCFGRRKVGSIAIEFAPASLYCYRLGRDIIRQKSGAAPGSREA
jgi:hypothetical protein